MENNEAPVNIKKMVFGIVAAVIAIGALIFGYMSMTTVKTGQVAVVSLFGKVRTSEVYREGFYFLNPLLHVTHFSVQRETVEMLSRNDPNTDKAALLAMSSDNLMINVDVNFNFKLQPEYSWWIYQNIGDETKYIAQLIQPAARATVRDVIARYPAMDAAVKDRQKVEIDFYSTFKYRLNADLQAYGMSPEQSDKVFLVLPVAMRDILPPETVRKAVEAKVAAEQDLARQVTLNDIATKEAERRSMEGQGVKNMFDNLPTTYKPAELAMLLNALAGNVQASAILESVRSGKVNVMVLGGSPSVSMPTPPPAKLGSCDKPIKYRGDHNLLRFVMSGFTFQYKYRKILINLFK